MIEKSIYENYEIDFSDVIEPAKGDYLFVFNDNRELYLDSDMKLPESLDMFEVNFCLLIGIYKGKRAFAVNVNGNESFHPLQEVYECDRVSPSSGYTCKYYVC